MNNVFYGKLDRDSINKLEKNEKTTTPEKEKKEENDDKFEDLKLKSLHKALDNKDKGVEKFKNKKFNEASIYFCKARKIMEKDLQQEINDKVPNEFDNYIKILRNEFWSIHNEENYEEADEKIDFILKILADDKRALEILELKAINYEKFGARSENIKPEYLLKAEEIYKKLVQMEDVSNHVKINFKNQIAIIQRKILLNEPEYAKKLKDHENFEKKCESFKNDETNLLIFLKVII